jgi:hypothetical protein
VIDVSIYVCFLFISLFLLIQNSAVIKLQEKWYIYVLHIFVFLEGILCIWLLKIIIAGGYEHKIYVTYILYRFISISVLFSIISIISVFHLLTPQDDISDLHKDILDYYLLITLAIIFLIWTYLIISTVVYSFHCSIVKTFYKIVAIIVEVQSQSYKERNGVEVCQGIPDICIGVPYYDPGKTEDHLKDEFSSTDAKFEVEIELENNQTINGAHSLSKI